MSISFDDAMATLSAMFDSFDRDTIVCVLEVNNGQLEATIDALLSMQNDSLGVVESVPSAQRPSVRLPDDFLRVPTHTSMSKQEEEDRKIAEMLQNEYFRQELLADQEFGAYLTSGNERRQSSVARRPSTEKSAMEVANETLSAVSGKLSTMSEAMRSKMYSMYTRFQTRNDSAAHRDPDSRRRLMSMSDDEDEDERTRQTQERDSLHRRKTQANEATSNSSSRRESGQWTHSKSD
ncbi:hypothetical protein THRCLA_06838 [Thraustotheca clavata]|uniref:CUE domain-containing protein n=1 Tax=Thraustotheca clavata TaxID=74557 RepID=A0A1V9ZIL5_9STRA|nr:hypothetical protein THRCLA_06838 [Thraustotheca clavata]